MYSVWREKKSAGIQYSKNPFLKKVSMAFHCPQGERKSLVPNVLCGVATPY